MEQSFHNYYLHAIMARPFEFEKEEILSKAMILFWDKGYFNTSAQEIVDHLGISRSSVYNSFSDKRKLFIEALRFYINTESTALIATLNHLPPTPESVRLILEHIVNDNFRSTRPKGCLAVNTAIEFSNHDEEIKGIIKGNLKQVISVFADFMEKGQQQKTINTSIDAEDLAMALSNQVTAIRVAGRVITNKAFYQKSINAFITLFNYHE